MATVPATEGGGVGSAMAKSGSSSPHLAMGQ